MAFNLGSILNKGLPLAGIMESLTGTSPEMRRFITSSLSAGYGAKQIIEFLRNQVGSQPSVSKGTHLRPDEGAALQRREKEGKAVDIAQNIGAGAIGLGAGVAGNLLSSAAQTAAQQPEQSIQQTPNKPKIPIQQPKQNLAQQAMTDVQKQQGPIFDPLETLKKKHPNLATFVEKEALKGSPADVISNKSKTIKALQKSVDAIESETKLPFAQFLTQILGSNISPKTNSATQSGDDELISALQSLLNR